MNTFPSSGQTSNIQIMGKSNIEIFYLCVVCSKYWYVSGKTGICIYIATNHDWEKNILILVSICFLITLAPIVSSLKTESTVGRWGCPPHALGTFNGDCPSQHWSPHLSQHSKADCQSIPGSRSDHDPEKAPR